MSGKHVVVLGAGFAGLHAVRVLSREPGVQVTLVDRNNYHLFQPLLYQVATAGLEAPQIAFPVRAFLRKHKNARFLLGTAEGVDPKARVLWVEGRPVPYDYLIVGTGTRTNDFGLPGVARYGYGLKDLDDAMKIRDRILSACEEAVRTSDPERRKALLTFVVVGGGPTGVELAGALGEVRRHVIARDYPDLDLSEIRVILIENSTRLLDAFAPSSAQYAQRFLEKLGVELRFGERVTEVTPDAVRLQSGSTIPSFTVVWSAGVTGQALPGLPITRGNRVATTPELYVPEHPSVYVAGDMNFLEHKDGRPHPQVAPTAMQQGALAAQNILRELRGQEKQVFRYKDKGSMATLGRSHAIAEIGHLKMRGFPAWGAWLAVHLYYLIGFRNRMMVLSNWAYSYFTYDFAVRIMHNRHSFPVLNEPAQEPVKS
ncbi:NAD(P)/FAD-dependent oxidoreductase [Meiothermus hypogaeus]|uniref:NADH:ubiquinone reductase (non-electrogenic) n=2 Tax=Meiothermus hypogaeus TaxID=884155 RepID=A0A511QZ68_9DEIN|nr:NAD(P)/FAD-dependent oxidoreductase [Meiothermus hypogaeus]RIH79692.1 NADH dehydrogenase-like protein YjlD [Meiothermus hypogaeus]GEM82673.1 pyridine nucleotide-disulfide oxidoreductase [Meiothermus hypogaeus NBRC 106114]